MVQLEDITHLQLSTHPNHLPPTHPLIHAIRDITVVVNKVAQNPAVLAGYRDSYKTLAKRLL